MLVAWRLNVSRRKKEDTQEPSDKDSRDRLRGFPTKASCMAQRFIKGIMVLCAIQIGYSDQVTARLKKRIEN